MLQLLLDLRANVHAEDRFGGTPLEDALRERKEQAMKILVDAGAGFKSLESALQLCQVRLETCGV